MFSKLFSLFNQVRELYFEQELTLREVGRRLGKNTYALKKLFEKMEWDLRGSKCDSIEEREVKKKKHKEGIKRK